MANLTITFDDETLRLARIRALRQGTSVNALLRDYLEAYAVTDRSRQVLEGFLEVARRSRASSRPEGRTWSRDELYERENVRRHECAGPLFALLIEGNRWLTSQSRPMSTANGPSIFRRAPLG